MMKTLGIITARSGSKGLKDKNIKMLNGKELIAYTIEAAISSKCFDTVMVSTDSEKYGKVSMKYGAEVPFLRSQKTSADEATTKEVVIEVLDNYQKQGKAYDRFVILQPTSPLRTSRNIQEAVDLFDKLSAKGVVSVCEVEHSPLWCNTLPKDKSLKGFLQTNQNYRRQNLETYYRLNGAIYLYDTEYYLNSEDVYGDKVFAYIMKREESVDIDTQLDFDFAELLMVKRSN